MEAIESRGFERSFDVRRMYANGNPEEFKPTVYALTNIDTCGDFKCRKVVHTIYDIIEHGAFL